MEDKINLNLFALKNLHRKTDANIKKAEAATCHPGSFVSRNQFSVNGREDSRNTREHVRVELSEASDSQADRISH